MNANSPSPATAPFRDCRTGLIVFGALLIAYGMLNLGALAAIFQEHDGFGSVFGSILSEGTTAAWVIALGLGSIFARRWAPALAFSLGVMGLTEGLGRLPIEIMFLKTGFSALWFGTVVGLCFSAALILFYLRPDVRKTCEVRDPHPRWTDRCPLAVLVCCIWLVDTACKFLTNLVVGGLQRPEMSPGVLRPALLVLFSAAALFAAVGIYRMNHRVWSLFFGVFLVFGASLLVLGTRSPHAATHPAAPASAPLPAGMSLGVWWGPLSFLAIGLGYLLWARRSFAPRAAPPAT